jgi:hypothetical protein
MHTYGRNNKLGIGSYQGWSQLKQKDLPLSSLKARIFICSRFWCKLHICSWSVFIWRANDKVQNIIVFSNYAYPFTNKYRCQMPSHLLYVKQVLMLKGTKRDHVPLIVTYYFIQILIIWQLSSKFTQKYSSVNVSREVIVNVVQLTK